MGQWRVRKTRTASGAVAVQLVRKSRGAVVEVEHVGSAHCDAELALLVEAANGRLSPGQDAFDLGPLPRTAPSMGDVADWTGRGGPLLAAGPGPGRPPLVAGGARVASTSADALWRVLEGAWERLGFATAVPDRAFAGIALARVVEATSKAGALRVLAEVGAPGMSERTVFRMLRRCVDRDYRGALSGACDRWVSRGGRPAMVLYDATNLECRRRHSKVYAEVSGMPTGWVLGLFGGGDLG
ncbi:MAG: hypothetical protein LBD77_11065 [Bifidobacteriaceae bacterium]|nr:hypothetical protein [Bifidobacteriaceae bacterium]